ncbi:MAG TPA: hypothetical protein VK436_13710 [Methanocella sp.]|nr:hypothetical protein [Methanocella sp.]
MPKEIRRNLSYTGEIEGLLDVSGHVYNKVTVIGDLATIGNIDCNRLSIIGSFRDEGTLKTAQGTITGKASVNGVDSAQLKINGHLDVNSDARVKKLVIRGEMTVKGSIAAEKIDLLGDMDVKEDCTSETFLSRGLFTIGGLLNADRIDIRLSGNCKVKEIGGETIRIKRTSWALFNQILKYIVPRSGFDGRLTTDVIEGDDIYVEYTAAKTIRGNRVKIGKGCDIGLVEYKDSFEQDNDSQIKEHVKTVI